RRVYSWMLRVPVQTTFMILAVLLGALALPLVAGAIYQVIGTWQDRQRFPPSGRLVRVNERRMHIHVTGEGTPTVVFESGMGASCLSWTLVQRTGSFLTTPKWSPGLSAKLLPLHVH